MQGVCFQGIEKVVSRELADPVVLTPRDAIVRVSLAGLCGSDLHPFFGREVGLDPGTVMGHEMVGEIVELGTDAALSGLAVGDRVFTPFSTNCGKCFYCNSGLSSRCTGGQLFGWVQDGQGLAGCQSEFVRVPMADATLMKMPAGLSDEAALLLGDNFSTGYFCAEMAEVQPGGVYVVIGCGTVGQLCVLAALSLGAEKIFAIDLDAGRRGQVTKLGAIALVPGDAALLEIKQSTDGRGADAVMELVGLPAAQEFAYAAVRPGGVLSVIGCHCTPNFTFGPVDAYNKNLTYRTGRCPARHYMDQLSQRVVDGEFDLSSFITHQFGVSDAVRAYEVFSGRKDGCLKAVLNFN
ncbi:MAG: alcohol dehydrogenase catalytic domain-containing protein [Mariniblastus sp.]